MDSLPSEINSAEKDLRKLHVKSNPFEFDIMSMTIVMQCHVPLDTRGVANLKALLTETIAKLFHLSIVTLFSCGYVPSSI